MSLTSPQSSTNNAFVTLLTSDHYLPGALVLAESIRLSHGISRKGKGKAGSPRGSASTFQVVALITPETLSVQSIKALRRSGLFDWIVGVEPIGFRQILASSPSAATSPEGRATSVAPAKLDSELNAKILEMEKNLGLLGRPDLTNTLTKLHAWRLGRDSAHLVARGASSIGNQAWTGFDKVVFLDADALVLHPIDHLFRLGSDVHFAAAPDTGWPDAFNSGVMMLTPSTSTFEAIRAFARSTGSWDGADQGLLNDYFGPEQGTGDFADGSLAQDAASAPDGGWKRLSFRYNVTSHGGYTFAPAYQRYGQNINVVHFIGQNKPWNRQRPFGTAQPNPLVALRDLDSQTISPDQPDYLLALWHSAFASLYPSSGSTSPDSEIEIVHTERGVEVVERRKFTVPTYHAVWDAEAHEENVSSSVNDHVHSQQEQQQNYDHLSHAQSAAWHQVWEAAYASLPLDGRSSLMAPAPKVARTPSPPTPTQAMIDAEAKARETKAASGPATQAKPIPVPGASVRGAADRGEDSDESPQPASPPKLSWNPAHEPPPTGSDASLYQMRTPIDAFYSNAWDGGEKKPRTLAEQKAAFFVPKQPASQQRGSRPQGGPGYIPSQLRRDHVFDNLGSSKPDPSKVKPIFPWEAKQNSTTAPTRVFPDEPRPSPPPSLDTTPKPKEIAKFGDESAAAPASAPAPVQRNRGLPANLSFVNAWDQAGAIGNFANFWNHRTQPTSPGGRRSRPADLEISRPTSRTSSQSRQVDSRWGSSQRNVASSTSSRPGQAAERRASLEDVNDAGEDEASDSRDGDDESSSGEESSGNDEPSEIINADGREKTPSPTNSRQAGWPREGPGKGYMRKAENSMYAQMHATPRSPRMTSRVLSNASTATEGEGRSGGRFSSSSSASASTVTSEGAAARQRAKDRIRPDGWVSGGSASGMSSPQRAGQYHMNASSLRGIPGIGAVGGRGGAVGGSAYAANVGRRREGNSSNESSGANSPTALLSPTIGSTPYSMTSSMAMSGMNYRSAAASRPAPNRSNVPEPPSLDEPFSSSPVNLRSELSQQARTHQQARTAQNPRGSRTSRP